MSEIKGFVMSLISAAAVTGLLDCFVPDSGGKDGMKKYLRYLTALAILLTLLTPLKSLVAAIPEAADAAAGEFDYGSVEAFSRVNSLIALHIRDSVAEKFALDPDEVSAELGEKLTLTVKRRFGLIGSDIVSFVRNNFGIEAEVVFYE